MSKDKTRIVKVVIVTLEVILVDLRDHVDVIFSQMLEDLNYIKLMTFFCVEEEEEIEILM